MFSINRDPLVINLPLVTPMPEENFLIYQAVARDSRYPVEAYQFVREAMAFADDTMEMDEYSFDSAASEEVVAVRPQERHLTGQQLCEAIRRYSLNQFGYMSRIVLKNWGIESTSSFGDIVYNMIDAGIMKKSTRDRRSHFDDVFSFDVLETDFSISSSVAPRRS